MEINKIKKAELHCHLDGIINSKYFSKLKFLEQDSKKFTSFFPITNIQEWFQFVNYKSALINDYDDLLFESLKLYINELILSNVKYVEIMLTNILFKYQDFDKTIQLFHKYNSLKQLYKDININFIMAIGRTQNKDRITNQINRIIDLYNLKLISGIAIAGDEKACTIKKYNTLFKKLNDSNVNIEIHAGEWGDVESIWDAIEYGFCKRIGHGLSAFNNSKLIDTILKKDIHIEFCPTSNLILTNYNTIASHPIKKAQEIGINYSINTDDPGDFQIDINHEYKLAMSNFNLTEKDFEVIYNNAIRSAFKND